MFHVLRFWLDRGVDGFRVDVMWMLIKDDQFRDNPINPASTPDNPAVRLLPVYNTNRPEVHAIVADMRAVLDSYGDRLLIGEIYLPFDQLAAYYGQDLKGAQLPFNFHLMLCPWNADAIAKVIQEYEAALPVGAWPNWVSVITINRASPPHGSRPSAHCCDVAAHPAGHADDVLRAMRSG